MKPKIDTRQLIIEPRGDTWLIFVDKKGSVPSLTKRELLRQTPCGATEEEAKKIAEIIRIERDIKADIIVKNSRKEVILCQMDFTKLQMEL